MASDYHFLINPISGGKNKAHIPTQIKKHFEKFGSEPAITITSSEKETIEQAQKLVKDNTPFIVAVGGDGTINNIARNVANTQSTMGIIPLGSGNGFARELGLYGNLSKSLSFLTSKNIRTIDTASVNGNFFNNLAGVGFDAHIGNLFANSGSRGFKTYAKLALREFNSYKPNTYRVEIDGKLVFNGNALLIAVCNGPQFGNNAFIAPGAKLDDGKLDICVVKKFPAWASPAVGLAMFTAKAHVLPWLQRFSGKSITIHRESEDFINLDGEPLMLDAKLNFEIKPQTLKVLAPKTKV